MQALHFQFDLFQQASGLGCFDWPHIGDDFDFGKIAVIPPFIYLGLSLLVMFLNLGIWGTWAALTPARAFAYSLAVLIFDLALMTLFASRL
jgi:hypothetical protein